MKLALKSLLVSVSAFIIGLVFLLLFVVKADFNLDTSEANSLMVSGIVENVYEDGVKDLVFKIEDDNRIFYINRGLESCFNLKEVQSKLQGQNIQLWYAQSRQNRTNHITHLKYNEDVLYSEWSKKSLASQ